VSKFEIKWIDRGREPQRPPNPSYPSGIDVDVSHGAEPACVADLPYPARRCGFYFVKCSICGYVVALTTAGRPDDPRSIRVPCQLTGAA
jgi:hypothetical protein